MYIMIVLIFFLSVYGEFFVLLSVRLFYVQIIYVDSFFFFSDKLIIIMKCIVKMLIFYIFLLYVLKF